MNWLSSFTRTHTLLTRRVDELRNTLAKLLPFRVVPAASAKCSCRDEPEETLDLSPEDQILWDKLGALELDKPVPYPFSKRLAKEQGWCDIYTRRCMREYRKFLLLTEKRRVSPPHNVDMVWHLHQIYSVSYRVDLERNTLGHPLFHFPEDGTPQNTAELSQQYRDTLELYRNTFGVEPPKDIWGE